MNLKIYGYECGVTSIIGVRKELHCSINEKKAEVLNER
jgi:hypothetical protein